MEDTPEESEDEEVSEVEKENRRLRAQLKAATNQLNLLSKENSKAARKRFSQGPGRYKKRTLQNEDSAAQQVINDFWKKIIRHHKEIDPRHRVYSDAPNTPSGIIMKKVVLPEGETEKSYWEEVLVYPWVYKKQTLLSKMLGKQQTACLGKVLFSC